MMNQIAVEPTIAVFEGVDVDEPEGSTRSRSDGIEVLRSFSGEGKQTVDQIREILWAR
jgi:hypothetical protein